MLSIQTNMLAYNASRQLKINSKKTAKNTEKLSSGYRINRAADDAAGLSISETMRRQIRGLKQGSDNIVDGISLLQVADGALDEVVDILHRINELSVKAYNGTNAREDREYIQEEITQLIDEIVRTADTTTFNEIKVLKGNPSETVALKIEEDIVYTDYLELESAEREIPDWLKSGVDTELKKHSYTGLTQDVSGIMYKATSADSKNQIIQGEYYGPNKGNGLYGVYDWSGRGWTPTLDDNKTARISFSGLLASGDAAELYTNMVSLLGSAIGIPCGTCTAQYYGIGFEGEVDGILARPRGYLDNYDTDDEKKREVRIGGIINLSSWKGFTSASGENVNCFDKIKELMETQAKDAALTEAAKKTQVQNLAAEVAGKLRDQTYQTVTKVTDYEDHFDRAVKNGNYDIIVYDYRDEDVLSSMNAADAPVITGAVAEMKIPYSALIPGTIVPHEEEHPLRIVCSAQFGDVVPLELPLISTETMGIRGYNVARYTVTETYSDAYKAKLEAWENAFHFENKTVTIPEHIQSIAILESCTPIFDANGECKKMDYKYRYEEKRIPETTKTISEKVYDYAKPEPEEGDIIRTVTYDPDNNALIGDALRYVLDRRTVLGAQQNRLEHAYNNNQNKHENTTASESRIRDADISKEAVAFSNNNILMQSVASMLSQANQSSELLLQLLS